MSISGYAELMMNRMVKDTDIPEFSNRIYDEANRASHIGRGYYQTVQIR